MTEPGSLRVWNYIRNVQEFFDVPHLDAAKWFLAGLIMCDPKADWVLGEAWGLEQFIDGGWAEWHDHQGDDITALVKEIVNNENTDAGR